MKKVTLIICIIATQSRKEIRLIKSMKKYIVFSISILMMYSCVNKNEKIVQEKIITPETLKTIKNSLGTEIFYLHNGINYLDLNNDDINDMVVKGFKNNISAHSFSNYVFYISDKNYKKSKMPQWNIVSINDPLKYSITTNDGADGILSGIVFVKNKNNQIRLIQATRTFGKSFADSETVTFCYNYLTFDETDNSYSYKIKSQKTAKQKYVDVFEAINKELKLE
jgi:hypothetical protein